METSMINSDLNILGYPKINIYDYVIDQSNRILNWGHVLQSLSDEDLCCSIESQLTQLLFIKKRNEYGEIYDKNALALMDILKANGGRQVCQYPFRKNDIVWICRTCQRGINHDITQT